MSFFLAEDVSSRQNLSLFVSFSELLDEDEHFGEDEHLRACATHSECFRTKKDYPKKSTHTNATS